jgi:hypothetical protein
MMSVVAVRLGIRVAGQAHSQIRSNAAIREARDEAMPQGMKAFVGRASALACPWGDLAQDSRLLDDGSKLAR